MSVLALIAEMEREIAVARASVATQLRAPVNVLGACAAMREVADLEAAVRVLRRRPVRGDVVGDGAVWALLLSARAGGCQPVSEVVVPPGGS